MQNFKRLDFYAQKIRLLQKQIDDYSLHYKQLTTQSELKKKDLQLAEKQFDRSKRLFSQEVISKSDYEKAEKQYLQEEIAYENTRATCEHQIDHFPHMEFGMLKGELENISLVPTATDQGVFYTAEITIPEGMLSNYNKQLAFTQEMTGIADIITDGIRLLQRFFNPIKAIFKQNVEWSWYIWLEMREFYNEVMQGWKPFTTQPNGNALGEIEKM